jgi:hypothetical protein
MKHTDEAINYLTIEPSGRMPRFNSTNAVWERDNRVRAALNAYTIVFR